MRLLLPNAVARIEARGALLVFPIDNRPLPLSLWSEFFPKRKMIWEWNETSDDRVPDMWSMMKRLSDCREVVYSKWYQGRATFFSRELFTAMLCLQRLKPDPRRRLPEPAKTLFDVLESNSPLSTKQLKLETDLQGKMNEPAYSRGMKELFTQLLIVGFGEVADGAFPSLAVGATELLFEDLWRDADEMAPAEARSTVDRLLPQGSHFRRHFDKSL